MIFLTCCSMTRNIETSTPCLLSASVQDIILFLSARRLPKTRDERRLNEFLVMRRQVLCFFSFHFQDLSNNDQALEGYHRNETQAFQHGQSLSAAGLNWIPLLLRDLQKEETTFMVQALALSSIQETETRTGLQNYSFAKSMMLRQEELRKHSLLLDVQALFFSSVDVQSLMIFFYVWSS